MGIKDELPEIKQVTRLVNPPGVSQNLIEYEDKQFYESDGYIADSTLFDIFTYEFKEGNPKKALVDANSIVITEQLSEKLFGDRPALNKLISVNQGGPTGLFKITGVLKENQKRSHLKANFFVSMTSTGWAEYLRSPAVINQWAGQNFLLSYIKLEPGTHTEDFIPKMNKVFIKYGADDLKALGMQKQLSLYPLKDLYLYSSFGNVSPRITYLYVIGSIAVFILLIACINFMNLSTAKAIKRANEVGVRKTLGAIRSTLIIQFLGEAMIIVVVAICISLVLVQLVLPFFNHITLKEIGFNSDNTLFFVVALTLIALATGLIAGSYPAFYLSAFQPAKVLKGKAVLNQSGGLMRKSLVVFQFVIAITLVCGMIMVTRQLDFMQEKDLGFDAENKLILPLRTEESRNNHEALINELERIPSVKKLTATNYVPGSPIWNDFTMYKEGTSMAEGVMIKNARIEPNYLDVMDIKLIAGRSFSEKRESELQNKVIINEESARALGLDINDLVNQQLFTDRAGEQIAFDVVGVIQDYHQSSLHHEIYPIAFFIAENLSAHRFAIIELESTDIQGTLARIESKWKSLNTSTPFEYTFLDENILKQYEQDKRVSMIITSFTIIAMIISCLGLYGLSTFMAERRVKEIGIRKVMGAEALQLVQMMSGEFAKLVIISFAISIPLAWYAISSWQESFAYKAPVDLLVFLVAGLSALGIAMLTVSFESIRAAMGNPINALRNE